MELPFTYDEIADLVRADTERVFSTMLGVSVQPGATSVGAAMVDQDAGVVSIVGFTGPWTGSGTIHCSARLACVLSGKMLMAEYEQVNEDVLDAIGEIGNMIVGNFKDDAAYKLGPLSLSTPTVIHGDNFQTRNWNGQSWITVPFECEGEFFEVKICLVPSQTLRESQRPAGLALSKS